MTEQKSGLTREGAIALTAATVLLVTAGIVAIVVGAWQPAAIGALLFLGVIVVGSVADRLHL
jgi:CHASE2 domain-containing sensor protein